MPFIEPTLEQPSKPTIPSLLAALQTQIFRDMNCVKIGVVQSFDAAKQEVTVKIAMQQVTSQKPDGTKMLAEYPLLLRVPVFFPSGGGFTLTFPIGEGDECIVLFNDRQIDNWLTQGGILPPTSNRTHDISDGIALVGIRSNPRALSSVSTNSVQLRSDDGGTVFELGGGVVNITAPGGVNINTPTLTVSGDVIAGSQTISLVHHLHSGVQSGGSNTGEPVV